MKKHIKIIILITLMFLVHGCEKQTETPVYCWTCTTIYKKIVNVFPAGTETIKNTYDTKYCDMTTDEIELLEVRETYSYNTAENKIISVTTCLKNQY